MNRAACFDQKTAVSEANTSSRKDDFVMNSGYICEGLERIVFSVFVPQLSTTFEGGETVNWLHHVPCGCNEAKICMRKKLKKKHIDA